MKVYIAGKLCSLEDRKKLEKIDNLCKELNIETFLPHRDMGVFEKGDPKPFFIKDRDEIDKCKFMIALLSWDNISSGTAWEIGYAHAKNIPVIGLVEDIKTINSSERVCVMCMNSVKLVDSLETLRKEIERIAKE